MVGKRLANWVVALLVWVISANQAFAAAAACREVMKFGHNDTAINNARKAVLLRQAHKAVSAHRPLFIVFSTTIGDSQEVQGARLKNIEQAIVSLNITGLHVEESGSADIYFTSDIYVDSCAADPKYN